MLHRKFPIHNDNAVPPQFMYGSSQNPSFRSYDWSKSDLIDSEIETFSKRNDQSNMEEIMSQRSSPCACQTDYDLLDLGFAHFPQFLVTAICQNRNSNSRKCQRGMRCKEIPYKVNMKYKYFLISKLLK